MKNLIRLLLVPVLLALAIALISARNQAYWIDNIDLYNETTSFSTGIGVWVFERNWEPHELYEAGDVVYHNGQYWIRTNNGNLTSGGKFEPAPNPPNANFWQPYN